MSTYQVRSVSLPARTQQSAIHRIETELNKLHDQSTSISSSTMAESIFFSLSRLEELHDCMDEILALQSIRHALSNAQNSLLDSLLEASLKLLDVCSSSRDTMLGIKDHVQDLQALMRRGASNSTGLDTIISSYTCVRKRMKKEAKRNISMLKQVEQDLESSMPSHPDQQLMSLIRGVKDVILTNASIFESLLMFLTTQDCKTKGSKAGKSKWSLALASRFKTKGGASSVNNVSANELGQLDAELLKNGTSMEVSSKMQTVNIIVDGMECSLERVFRCLIKTRASFLNIRSY